jgi:rhodanese-related sulfurtransferase
MRFLIVGSLIALAAALAAVDMPLVQPGELAAQLAAKGNQPVVLQVGPHVMYRNRHIAGSLFAGTGSRPEGLALLRTVVAKLAKDREIVIYCGCCPWAVCPNIKPAMAVLRQMGYTRVKALYIPDNLKKDWTDRGYPVASSVAQ